MTKIKLCGLMTPEDIECANELAPDYIGFVFWKKSRRYVEPEKARELKKALTAEVRSVGVFVDEDVSLVAKLINNGVIDAAQLHGSEDEEYIRKLRASVSENAQPDDRAIRIIKAFRVTGQNDVNTASASSADIILLDSGMGGGVTFDWDLLKGTVRPYLLAGGLDCANIEDAIRILMPYGVDVSSGIETGGVKDHDKMREFVRKVRNTGI